MSNNRKQRGKRFFRHKKAGGGQPPQKKPAIGVARQGDENAWKLVHPRCAREREEDLEEVQSMLDAGETEIAVDELRYLLDGCDSLIRAHRLLGEIAMTDGDLPLARGHFGYAYELGRAALPAGGLPGPLPHRFAENQALHESAKGLAWCLHELDKPKMALKVLEDMLRWDPTDPLGVRPWLESWG